MPPEQAFLQYVVEALVDAPQEIYIKHSVDEMGVLLEIEVAQADMGRLIGREGSTAKALRTLLKTVGMRNGKHINMKILEPGQATLPQKEKEPNTQMKQALEEAGVA